VRSCNPDGALKRRSLNALRQKAAVKAEKDALKQAREKQAAQIRGSAVVYVGHIPEGFYEEAQMKFFSQYGKVLRLRLSRDKTNGRSSVCVCVRVCVCVCMCVCVWCCIVYIRLCSAFFCV
jgi:hypothetical protein